MLESVEHQIERVRQDYPQLEVRPQSDGTVHVEIVGIPLPSGWNKERARILIVLAIGYPQTKPNGFEVDADLRLATGQMPKGASQSQIAGQTWTHVCWSPKLWDTSRENLWRYVKFVEKYFEESR